MMFHEGSRELQDRFDTRRIAERIDDVPVADTIDDRLAAFIGRQEMCFLVTADAEGRPTCSYKGGDRASSGRRRADPWRSPTTGSGSRGRRMPYPPMTRRAPDSAGESARSRPRFVSGWWAYE